MTCLLKKATALAACASRMVVSTILGVTCLTMTPNATAQTLDLTGKIETQRNVIAVVPRSWPPQYLLNEEGKPAGFAIDVLEAVAKRAGLTVKYVIRESWAEVAQSLRSGEADIVPNLGISDKRKEYASFTASVETFPISLFARSDSPNLSNLSGLSKRKVGAVQFNIAVRLLNNRLGKNLQIYKSFEEALFALLAGTIDVVAFPGPVAKMMARNAGVENRIKVIGPPLKEVKRAIAVRRDLPGLRIRLDRAIATFINTPAYREIYVRWYGGHGHFLTVTRVAWSMGGVMAVILIIMGWWRYRENLRMVRLLRESEALFRAVVDNSPTKIHIKDVEGRYLLINKEAEKLFGVTDEEGRGKTSYDLFAKDVADSFSAHDKAVMKSGMAIHKEEAFTLKDGVHTYLTTKFPIFDQDGITAIGAIGADITERKEAEREAAEKSALLETTLTNIAQGFCVFDSNQKLVAFNEGYIEMGGFPPNFIHLGIDRREVLRFLAKRNNHGEGEIHKWVEERISSMEAEEGIPIERHWADNKHTVFTHKPLPDGGFVATYTDITDLKLAKQEVVENLRLLDATFQNMAQGIAVFDSDHALVVFNPQYAEILGVPSEYVHTGINRGDIIPFRAEQGHYGECDIEALVKEIFSKAGQAHNLVRTLPDGSTYYYEHTPMLDGGYISTVTDITKRHEAEKQLQRARKMETVGQLTGGIAHDFNNFLAVSLGNVELAEEVAESGGDVRPFLATIKRASERGASLTNQLLAFSRKQTLFPQVIDAGELVGGMSHLLRSSLGETIEVKVTGGDGLWTCEVDPHQLESAILNLAINARDAMPEGGTLAIQTANVSLDDDYAAAQTDVEPGEYVLLAVSDTGTGMPKEVIDHIFDPFFTTKEAEQASGLGLSMVYGFVKQSGGHVTVYSEGGEGTTVTLYLPHCDKEGKHLGRVDQAEIPKALGETVLVVEDDSDLRTLAVALLRSFGYEILEAADGESALKALETAPRVNLLFSDVVLPGGMSGPALAVEARSRFPGIAVLYTSGYTDLANFDASTFVENIELLQKPYRKADLARKIRRALDQAQV